MKFNFMSKHKANKKLISYNAIKNFKSNSMEL